MYIFEILWVEFIKKISVLKKHTLFNKEGHYSYAVFEKHVESGTEKATLMDCDRQH